MKKISILLLIILIVAAITKPTEKSFNNYIKSELEVKKSDNLFGKIIKGGLRLQSSYSSQYEDKIFYAKANTSIGRKNLNFIGVFGFWFEE